MCASPLNSQGRLADADEQLRLGAWTCLAEISAHAPKACDWNFLQVRLPATTSLLPKLPGLKLHLQGSSQGCHLDIMPHSALKTGKAFS